MTKLKVVSSTPTKTGSFCNKLVSNVVITEKTAFGPVESNRQNTYYLFTAKENEVGFEAELNLDLFDIIEKPFDIEEEEVVLKYLYLKS